MSRKLITINKKIAHFFDNTKYKLELLGCLLHKTQTKRKREKTEPKTKTNNTQ